MPIADKELRAALAAAGDFLTRRRPRPEIRDQLDYKIDINGSDLTIFEVRPRYDDPSKTIEHGVAKMKWVGTKKAWRLFWMRGNLKWHSYEPKPEAAAIDVLFKEVEKDPHGCFFG